MAKKVTIDRPDVVALIEEAANSLTHGDTAEAVAMALRLLLDRQQRRGSLFGAHPNSVRIRAGVDLIAPVLDVTPDAETGKENDR